MSCLIFCIHFDMLLFLMYCLFTIKFTIGVQANVDKLAAMHANCEVISICDWICKKVPFPHILHGSKQYDVKYES